MRVYVSYITLSVDNDAHICISLSKSFLTKKNCLCLGCGSATNMFAGDFGYQIDHYATLVDPNNNEFQVLVERFNGFFF